MKTKKILAALTAATLAAVSAAAVTTWKVLAADEETEDAPYSAWLTINSAGSWLYGNEGDGTVAKIPALGGDGTYTASIIFPESFGGSDSISCFYLSTDINAYAYVKDGLDPWTDGTAYIAVDSIQVNHADGTTSEITYNGASEGAFAKENNGTDLRVNIYNTWTKPSVSDISSTVEDGLLAGDELVVTFTISGINEPYDNSEETTTEAPTTTVKPATTAKPTTKATTTTTTKAATTTTAAATSKLARGDFDGDGKITIQDAYNTLLAYSKRSAGKDSGLTKDQETALDVDGNGNIDIQDAYKILLYYSNQSAGNTVDWDKL